MSPVLKSYCKTTAACLLFAAAIILSALVALLWVPPGFGAVISGVATLAVLAAASVACGGMVVIARYRRIAGGERDLFLALNRSREPSAIKAAPPPRATHLRRWLSRRLLGHDLITGDLVQIKSWNAIAATLNEHGRLAELPFMPEMLGMCGKRARVFRCAHRIFDYRKTRRMRHMDGAVLLIAAVCDGSNHGGCDAACHTIWNAQWLSRITADETAADTALAPQPADPAHIAALHFGTHPPRYACQLTQLHSASQPVADWSVANFLRPLVAGNVAPAAFAIACLTDWFNTVQQMRGGHGFPAFEAGGQSAPDPEEPLLEAGDQVVVRFSAEIRATLDGQLVHRGLGFELDMLKHCGHRYTVQSRIRRLIDIVSGEMRTMRTPAYLLRDVHFTGERQFFNAQYEPLFWRGVWLKKESDSRAAQADDVARDPQNSVRSEM